MTAFSGADIVEEVRRHAAEKGLPPPAPVEAAEELDAAVGQPHLPPPTGHARLPRLLRSQAPAKRLGGKVKAA
jgi:hypothetical protein